MLRFLISLVLSVAFILLLSFPQKIGETRLPALGNFLNPFSGIWQNAEPSTPNMAENIAVEGLQGEVKVVYDERLVPHVFAENDEDLAFAQGYITAQHRLWQMEFQTHAIAGRLTEIVGAAALDMDKATRRMGLPRAAEKTLKTWEKSPSYGYAQRYVDGVNAYISSLKKEDLPVEYKLLGYKPEPWTLLKTALFVKAMANTLARQDTDIENTNMLKVLGKEAYDFLYPEWFEGQSPIIPKGVKWDFTPVAIPGEVVEKPKRRPFVPQNISDEVLPKQDPGLGSNNWAVAGSKTASGSPILCGDPHLELNLPSIWYEMQLSTPQYKVYGVTLPGIPSIIIGFNEHIAWSQTNVGRDNLDWYAIKWKDAEKTVYHYDSTTRKADIFIEKFVVRNGETVYDTVRYTHHGPVVFEDKKHPKSGKALRWIAHDPPIADELGVFMGLAKAKNYADYVKAIQQFHCPAQNYVFASKKGDVAIWCQGTYPLKTKQQGRFVLDGSTSKDEWKGYIPVAHNPHILNPMRGFVASANQHSTDPTYPYYYSGVFADFRGRYINGRLARMEKIKAEDMMRLQNDNFSLFAAEALPLMLAQLGTAGQSQEALAVINNLKKWDFRFEKDRTEPTFFTAFYDEFYKLLWDEVLQYEATFPVAKPEHWRTIELMRTQPTSPYFNIAKTGKTETFADICRMAFQRAFEQFGGNIPAWKTTKNTSVLHLAGKSLLPFGHTGVDVGGSKYAPNAISERNGPSWRMVVELGAETKAYGVYPGGQSGNPGSRFYDNMMEHWKKGEYYELRFLKSADDTWDGRLAMQVLKGK